MQSLKLTAFFWTKRIGEAQEEDLFWIKALNMLCLIHFLTSVNSESDMDYIRPIRGFLS